MTRTARRMLIGLALTAVALPAHAQSFSDPVDVVTQISNGLAPALVFDLEDVVQDDFPLRFTTGTKTPSYIEFTHDGTELCVALTPALGAKAQLNCQPTDGSTKGPQTTFQDSLTISVELSHEGLPDPTTRSGLLGLHKDCPPPSEEVYVTFHAVDLPVAYVDGNPFKDPTIDIREWPTKDLVMVDCVDRDHMSVDPLAPMEYENSTGGNWPE